jgi:hypothetical protein
MCVFIGNTTDVARCQETSSDIARISLGARNNCCISMAYRFYWKNRIDMGNHSSLDSGALKAGRLVQ